MIDHHSTESQGIPSFKYVSEVFGVEWDLYTIGMHIGVSLAGPHRRRYQDPQHNQTDSRGLNVCFK